MDSERSQYNDISQLLMASYACTKQTKNRKKGDLDVSVKLRMKTTTPKCRRYVVLLHQTVYKIIIKSKFPGKSIK